MHRRYSEQLLRTYTRQYERRRQYQSEEEKEYFEMMGVPLKKKENTREHWHYPFFRFCWDEGMSRLPMKENCPNAGNNSSKTPTGHQFSDVSARSMVRVAGRPLGMSPTARTINTTGQGGVPMGLAVHRSARCSACGASRKRRNTF